MRVFRESWWVAAIAAALASCATHRFPPETAREVRRMPADHLLEVTLTSEGRIAEVEFHVPPTEIPEGVHAAMNALVPGGEVLDCEIEYVEGTLHYEISKRVGGRVTEVMFDAGARPVQWEVEIDPAAAPRPVVEAAEAASPGTIRKIEEIRDGDRVLVAYHAKKEDRGVRYKIALDPESRVLAVYREVKAEVEVPLDR